MNEFMGIFENKILGLSLFSCLLAQFLKIITNFVTYKKFDLTRFVETGGMPSSHSSFVSTLTTCVGFAKGFSSPEFAISFVFSMIIMYDAAGVRKAVGEQAKIINKMIIKFEHKENVEQELKELIGHTRPQVLVGAVLGILIGLLYNYI